VIGKDEATLTFVSVSPDLLPDTVLMLGCTPKTKSMVHNTGSPVMRPFSVLGHELETYAVDLGAKSILQIEPAALPAKVAVSPASQ
jgi:hypothetical protein